MNAELGMAVHKSSAARGKSRELGPMQGIMACH